MNRQLILEDGILVSDQIVHGKIKPLALVEGYAVKGEGQGRDDVMPQHNGSITQLPRDP